MEISKLIRQVKEQEWPEGHYAVFGSALLAVNRLRECPNIDVITDGYLWEKLLTRYSPDSEGFIHIGNIKVSDWWFAPTRKDIPAMIKESDLIESVPFVRIEEVLSYKKGLVDSKNRNDVLLIEQFLGNKNQETKCLGIDTYKDVLNKFVNDVDVVFKKEILSMVVFGSVSRGEAKFDSDIDLFVFYNDSIDERKNIEKKLNKILLKIRDSSEYKSLADRGIYPEIYPFLISKNRSKDTLWVFLDASEDGIVIKDMEGFGTKIIEEVRKKIKKMGGRRVQLQNGGWCWSLFGDYSYVNKIINF